MNEAMIMTAMTWSQLVNMDNIFKLTFDLEKSTVDITILNVTIRGIKYAAVKALSDNPSKVKDIVDKVFIHKQVMWMDFRREDVDGCINSLKDLEEKLKTYQTDLLSTGNEDDKILAGIIEIWAVECNIAIDAFKTAIYHETLSRADFLSDRLPAQGQIIPVLGKFRSNTLNIVKEFIQLIEPGSRTRERGEELYNRALTELSQYFHVNQKDVRDLSFSVTLIPKPI